MRGFESIKALTPEEERTYQEKIAMQKAEEAFKADLEEVSRLNPLSETAEALLEIGGNRWISGDKDRIYFNDLAKRWGLQYTTYKSGSISSATLDDEPISNNKAYKLNVQLQYGKLWFDVKTGKWASTGLDEFKDFLIEEIMDDVRANIKKRDQAPRGMAERQEVKAELSDQIKTFCNTPTKVATRDSENELECE